MRFSCRSNGTMSSIIGRRRNNVVRLFDESKLKLLVLRLGGRVIPKDEVPAGLGGGIIDGDHLAGCPIDEFEPADFNGDRLDLLDGV